MVILNRMLKIEAEDGETPVPVRIFLPINVDDHWQCEYEIGWPAGIKTRKIFGIDSVQSLLLAMHLIGVDLNASDAHRSGKLVWEKRGEGYGFPDLSRNLPRTAPELAE